MIYKENEQKLCKIFISYYSELTELLGKKHSIQPLALSGRNGLLQPTSSNKEYIEHFISIIKIIYNIVYVRNAV